MVISDLLESDSIEEQNNNDEKLIRNQEANALIVAGASRLFFEEKMKQKEAAALNAIETGITTVKGESTGHQKMQKNIQSEKRNNLAAEKNNPENIIHQNYSRHMTRSEKMIISGVLESKSIEELNNNGEEKIQKKGQASITVETARVFEGKVKQVNGALDALQTRITTVRGELTRNHEMKENIESEKGNILSHTSIKHIKRSNHITRSERMIISDLLESDHIKIILECTVL